MSPINTAAFSCTIYILISSSSYLNKSKPIQTLYNAVNNSQNKERHLQQPSFMIKVLSKFTTQNVLE